MTARHARWMMRFFAVGLLLPPFAQASARSPTDSSCAPQTQSDVVARVEALFAALSASDDKAIQSVLAPDFYAKPWTLAHRPFCIRRASERIKQVQLSLPVKAGGASMPHRWSK